MQSTAASITLKITVHTALLTRLFVEDAQVVHISNRTVFDSLSNSLAMDMTDYFDFAAGSESHAGSGPFVVSPEPNECVITGASSSADQPLQLSNTVSGSSVLRPSSRSSRLEPDHPPQKDLPVLTFLPFEQWNRSTTYNDATPLWLRYVIEWKVTVNTKSVGKSTEQHVVIKPGLYFDVVIRSALDQVLRSKVAASSQIEPVDTQVTVAVNDRSERDLVKRFDGATVDWAVVEQQLTMWSNLCRAGKKLRVVLSMNYTHTRLRSSTDREQSSRRPARVSTTQHMLSDLATQHEDAETAGGSLEWPRVYRILRCTRPLCRPGKHCWQDPVTDQHYSLHAELMKQIIAYVQQGNVFESHDDVPDHIRDLIRAGKSSRVTRNQNDEARTSANLPPIHITNVIPAPTPQTDSAGDHAVRRASTEDHAHSLDQLDPASDDSDESEFLDLQVRRYSDWQGSRVRDKGLQQEYATVADVVVQEGYDLEQIQQGKVSELLKERGVKRGVIDRFVRDVAMWKKRCKRVRREETTPLT